MRPSPPGALVDAGREAEWSPAGRHGRLLTAAKAALEAAERAGSDRFAVADSLALD